MDYTKLSAAQEDAVRRMLLPESDGGALLAFDVGLGKTRTGLMFARASQAQVTLVVVPVSTVDDWIKTVPVEYPGMTASLIDSSKDGLRAMTNFQWRVPGVYIVGHEYWERKAWDKSLIKKRKSTDPDKFRKVWSGVWGGTGFTFIYDEVHRAGNPDSWTFKALMFLEDDIFKLGMSGTFMGDRFDGAYGATKWIWKHRKDIFPGKDHFDWRARWAEVKYSKFKPRHQEVVGEAIPGEFVKALPCYIMMESEVPDAIPHELWVDLSPEQRRVYDELDDRMVAWIRDEPLVTDLGITRRIRQQQVTLAMPTLTFDEDDMMVEVSFDDDAESVKIDRLFRALDGNDPDLGDLLVDEPMLILTNSQKFARIVVNRLNEKYGEVVAAEWSGKIPKKKRPAIKQAFIDGELRFIVGVQSAMGTGTNGLQHRAHIGAFMSRDSRRINNEQGIGRLARTGQLKQVHWLHFLARETLDTGEYSKQMQDAIKMKKIMLKKMRDEERQRKAADHGMDRPGRPEGRNVSAEGGRNGGGLRF